MIRKAFMIRAKKGMADEYKKRHNPIWPELEKTLRDHGVRNYSIFLLEDDETLFGYFEVIDERVFNRIADLEVCKRWWKYMTEVLVCESEQNSKAQEFILEEVFHLE